MRRRTAARLRRPVGRRSVCHACRQPDMATAQTAILLVTVGRYQKIPPRLFLFRLQGAPDGGLLQLSDIADDSCCFTVNELEALYELYEKISQSIFVDGLIHKLRRPRFQHRPRFICARSRAEHAKLSSSVSEVHEEELIHHPRK